MGTTHLKLAEQQAIIRLLEEHFVVADELSPEGHKVGRYRKGWNDTVLAKAVADHITNNQVLRIRQELFGHIEAQQQAARTRKENGKLPKWVDMCARVDKLEADLQVTNERLTKLLADLGN
jgi:hypothetical protein